MTFYDFVEPLAHAAHPCVMLPAVAYAMEFLWTSIMVTVEIPQLFPELFGFNTQQNGLQMIAIIVGTIIGEQIGGRVSDMWMKARRRKLDGGNPEPEWRLWLSYFGYSLCIIGVVVFLVSRESHPGRVIGICVNTSNSLRQVQLYYAGTTWNVTPLIGAGICSAGKLHPLRMPLPSKYLVLLSNATFFRQPNRHHRARHIRRRLLPHGCC